MIRDRIKELRRVKASDLRPNPKNWRTHSAAQRAALKGILSEVGYAGAVLAYEAPEGLTLIDGHLRTEATPGAEVPVLILDVTPEEADKLLLTLDPIGAMAGKDAEALASLLAEVSTDDDGLKALLAEIGPPPAPPPYSPTLAPETSEAPVTDHHLERAAEHLEAKTSRGQVVLREVTCPHCAGEFLVDPGAFK